MREQVRLEYVIEIEHEDDTEMARMIRRTRPSPHCPRHLNHSPNGNMFETPALPLCCDLYDPLKCQSLSRRLYSGMRTLAAKSWRLSAMEVRCREAVDLIVFFHLAVLGWIWTQRGLNHFLAPCRNCELSSR